MSSTLQEAIEALEGIRIRKKPAGEKLEAADRLVSADEEVPDWKEIESLITRGHLNEK